MKMPFSKRYKNAKGLSEQGFTMLEMLFAFSIFCIISTFLPLMFQIILSSHSMEARIQNMEWELFVNQLKKEIQAGQSVEVVNGQLKIVNGEDTSTFQKYQDILRKIVNGTGHEVVLQNVKSVSFSKSEQSVLIVVETSFNQTKKATIFSFIKKGG
ncbi:competence type IV pilus minor pilin ComGF [Robertmurraya sp. Marseille-Q9965]